jgi:hypothetical protein
MPLPSSGQISVSDINTELGRTSNTANSNFAGGSTPQSGSLFKLGEAGGINQTAPHAMSEWYNYPLEADFGLYGNTSLIDADWRGTGSSNWDGFGGTSCSDDINLYGSFNESSSTFKFAYFQMVTDVNPPSNTYQNAFTIYYKWNCAANNNMQVDVYISDGATPIVGLQTLVSNNTGSSSSASYNVLAYSSYTYGRLYFGFRTRSANQTGSYSGTFNITDINVVQQC